MKPEDNYMSDILHTAFPAEQNLANYVTKIELADAMRHVETKIISSERGQRNWVLGGCLATIVAFGGGYMSLVTKLDRLNDAMPVMAEIMDGRRSWMLRKDQIDAQQDRALQGVVPSYAAPPYVEPPK